MREQNQELSRRLLGEADPIARDIRTLCETLPLQPGYHRPPVENLARQPIVDHVRYLAEAVALGEPLLFSDYVGWTKVLLAGRGIPGEELAFSLECCRRVLATRLDPGLARLAGDYLEAGLTALPRVAAPPAPLDTDPLGLASRHYLEALLGGDRRRAGDVVRELLDKGTPVKDIYLRVFQRSQHEIGRLWQINRISVAQEHFCTAATQLIMSQLYDRIFSSERKGLRMVATCVSGELHELGIRMISDFFEMEGWDTFYVGASTPADAIVEMLLARRADLLAVSATMTGHVRMVAQLIAEVRRGLDAVPIRVIVGGHPFNVAPGMWQTVGADGCAPDANAAVRLGADLVAASGR